MDHMHKYRDEYSKKQRDKANKQKQEHRKTIHDKARELTYEQTQQRSTYERAYLNGNGKFYFPFEK